MTGYLPLSDTHDEGMQVTPEEAENREHGKLIQKLGGFVSLGGALMMMTVRVKGKSEKQLKKAKLAKIVMVAGGFGVFALSQMESL